MKPLSLRMFVLGAGTALLAACGGKPQKPPQMPPPQVGVLTVQHQKVPLSTSLPGRLSAYRTADVRARVSGILLKRTYDEGTDVKKGQTLFQIDPAPLRAKYDAAKAALAQAQATYTNNRIAAKRVRKLAPKGYVSKSDLDNAEAAERTAEAAVKQARADVESARINLDYASVKAPISGRAGKQQVTEGALVGQSSATLLTTVDQIDPLYVNFSMGVDKLDTLRKEQSQGQATLAGQNKGTVRLELPGGNTYDKTGVVDFSGSSVDPTTGAVQLRAKIANPDHTLLPGMYTQATVTLGNLDHAYLIPEAAVQRDQKSAYVMLVGPKGNARQTPIETAGSRNHDWIVTSGLHDGDKVIVEGLANVKAGKPVKASPWHGDNGSPQATASVHGQPPVSPASVAGAKAPASASSQHTQ